MTSVMSLRKNVPPIPGCAPAAGISSCGADALVATIWPLAPAAVRMTMMVTMALRMQNLLFMATMRIANLNETGCREAGVGN